MTNTDPITPIVMLPTANGPEEPGRPSGQIIDGKLYLTIAEYVKSTGAGHRSVTRWIADGELPGVVREPDGNKRHFIPADATRVKNGGFTVTTLGEEPGDQLATAPARGGVLEPVLPAVPKNRPTLEELLAAEPAYIPLDRAAVYSGLTMHFLETNQERYGIVRGGKKGRLVMPRAEIMKAAGLMR